LSLHEIQRTLEGLPFAACWLDSQGCIRAHNSIFQSNAGAFKIAADSEPYIWEVYPQLEETNWSERWDRIRRSSDSVISLHGDREDRQCVFQVIHENSSVGEGCCLVVSEESEKRAVRNQLRTVGRLVASNQAVSVNPLLVVDPEHDLIIGANAAAREILEEPDYDLTDIPASSIFGDQIERLRGGFSVGQSSLDLGDRTVTGHRRSDAAGFSASVSPMRIENHTFLSLTLGDIEGDHSEDVRSEEILKLMADEISQIFYVVDLESRSVKFTNPHFREIFGRETPAPGTSIMDWALAIHPTDRERVIGSFLEQVRKGPVEEVYRIIRPDGEVRWLRDRAFPIDDSHIAGVAEDFTGYRTTLEALRLSEERFATIFRSNPGALIISLVSSGCIVEVSAGFERVFGHSREEAIGSSLADLGIWQELSDRDRLENMLARYGGYQGVEVGLRNKDGQSMACLTSGEVVQIDGVNHLVTIAEDVTSRRNLQHTLKVLAASSGSDDRHDLCRELARQLAKATDARTVVVRSVDQFTLEPKECLAQYPGNDSDPAIFDPDNEISKNVISLGTYFIAQDARQQHPSSVGFQEGEIESFLGCSVFNSSGQILAIIGLCWGRPFNEVEMTLEIVTVFASRLGLELERLQAAHSLRQSETDLRLAQTAAGQGTWAWDFETATYHCSNRTAEIYNILKTPERLTVEEIANLVHPEDRAQVMRIVEEARDGRTNGGRFYLEHRVAGQPAAIKWVAVFGQTLLNSQGVPRSMTGVVMDITERKRADQILVEQEATLSTILSAVSVGIACVVDRKIDWVNDRFCEMMGYQRFELLGADTLMVYPSREDYEQVGKEFYGAVSETNRGEVEAVFRRKNGDSIDVLLSGSWIDAKDTSKGVIVSFLDITDRKKTESAFRRSQARFRAMFESANAGIVLTDLEGSIIQTNLAYGEMLRKNPRDLIGKNVLDHTQKDFVKDTQRLMSDLKHGILWDSAFEKQYIRDDGSILSVSVVASAVKSTSGQIENLMAVVVDITQQKQAERDLQYALLEVEKLKTRLEAENVYLREEVEAAHGSNEVIGVDPAFVEVMTKVRQVGATNATVLISGETGVGKEVVASEIHRHSRRSGASIIRVNCASIPRELFESEFFGHVRGSFTGAVANRTGRFELADGGTLMLDEVGEIPLELQSKLLRVLQEGEYERIGEEKTRRADVRLIACTNRDLQEEVRSGNFREDLYYRLSVFPIEVPPLRERPADVAALTRHFMRQVARRIGVKEPVLTDEHMRRLEAYAWPGNVRELQNVIERALIASATGDLIFSIPGQENDQPTQPERRMTLVRSGEVLTDEEMRQVERENTVAALEQTDWCVAGERGAARLLGVSPSTLYSRIKALEIEKPRD